MKIRAIQLKHTNPSLGPHEKIIKISLQVNEFTENVVNEFLGKSVINGTMGLKEFIEAQRSNNTLVLKMVEEKCKSDLNQGSPISVLTFSFEDGKAVEIYDVYRRYHVSHFYPDFTKYMVAKGVKSECGDFITKDRLNDNTGENNKVRYQATRKSKA